jgi:drug/metabolite transporter (DMT)-like permease
VAVVLGLVVALTYGAGDFLGGLASRAQSVATVVVASQACGLGLVVVALVVDGSDPAAGDVALGVLAGSAGLVGLLLLYRGLAVGTMGVVAPVTAVGAAVVPLAVGLATGERPSPLALVGAAVALAAVVLVASGSEEGGGRRAAPAGRSELLLALGAGAGFGLVFVILDATSEDSGFWPLLGARVASVSLVAAWLASAGRPLRPRPGTGWAVVGAGVLDMTANACYLLAVREGLLSLVAVLSSLYPAATVVLARWFLGERLRPAQVAGLGLGLAGVALIAAG